MRKLRGHKMSAARQSVLNSQVHDGVGDSAPLFFLRDGEKGWRNMAVGRQRTLWPDERSSISQELGRHAVSSELPQERFAMDS